MRFGKDVIFTKVAMLSDVKPCMYMYVNLYLFPGMDHCFNSPCQNNGTCHNLEDNYTCVCPAVFTGYNCEGWS